MNQFSVSKFFNIKAMPAAALTAAVFFSITAWLCWLTFQASQENAQRRLQENVFQHHANVQNELEHEVSRLESFVSLYNISPNFDRYAFHSFAKIENQPWLVAKLFSKRVSFHDFATFENAVKTDTTVDVRGYPKFQIQDKVPGEDALVALYMEPRQTLENVHGLNLEKWFSTGSKRMKELGQPLSFMVNDNHAIVKGKDIIFSIPVYEAGLPVRSVTQRKIAFSGTFTTVIAIDKLLHHLFDATNLHLTHAVLSGTGMENETLDIDIAGKQSPKPGLNFFPKTHTFTLPLAVPGKKWQMRYEIQTSDDIADRNIVWLIAIIGSLLSIFATGFIYVTVQTGKIANRLAREMTRALHVSENSLLETQRLARMGSFQLDGLRQVTALTGNIQALFGLTQEEKVETLAQILQHVDPEDAFIFNDIVYAAMETALHTHQIVQITGASTSWINLIIDSSNTEPGSTLRIIAMDVTEKYQAEQKIKHLAYQDTLTGLANRASLRLATEHALENSRLAGNKLALLFLDLDRFKFINDSAGHDIGDQVLAEIGQRLRNAVKSRDFIARLGGDEFVILVEELASESDLRAIADRILSLVCAPMIMGQHTYYLTTSIGIAVAEHGLPDVDALMKQADIAMYHSKERGKNKYTVFSREIADELEKKTSLEREMRVSIEESRFIPHFQPQYRVDTNQLCGVESLLRWDHPIHGLISAKKFIKTAEESGLIIHIGNQVLVDVCNTIAQWSMPDNFVVGVNVSSLQFFQAGFVDFVINTIRQAGIAPQRLEIEVTETMIMQDTEVARSCLEQLHAFGIGVSIDDFGTGYASLTYLRDFPVQRIKIDQRFVSGLNENHKDMAIVKAIATLGHDFGMQVIAEGVETEEQLASLANLGCDLYQGWLRSNALPANEIKQLLSC